jgi:putative heme-binding domain-containing protein
LLDRLAGEPGGFLATEQALTTLAEVARPGFDDPAGSNERPEERTRRAAAEFWSDWFARRFGKRAEIKPRPREVEMTNERLRDFLVSDAAADGNPARGRELYIRLECQKCHGGAVAVENGTVFGPDLAGVTQRLDRGELADAIVDPSRQVAERFQGVEVELRDGRVLTGFVTEESTATVTFVDRDRVYRLQRPEIAAVRPQSISLMPEGLLNQLKWSEIRDLLAFLGQLGSRPVGDR